MEPDDAEVEAPPEENVTTTTFPPATVPAPMLTMRKVELVPTTHCPKVPPNVTVQVACASCDDVMKLVPVTVILLPM